MKTQIRGRAGLSAAVLLLTAGRGQAVLPPSDEKDPSSAPCGHHRQIGALRSVHKGLKEAGKLITWARVPPPQEGFAYDQHAPLVYALEEFDEETGTATKAEIFPQRVTAPRQVPDRAPQTPEEAAAISLAMYGEIRLDVVARLLDLADE